MRMCLHCCHCFDGSMERECQRPPSENLNPQQYRWAIFCMLLSVCDDNVRCGVSYLCFAFFAEFSGCLLRGSTNGTPGVVSRDPIQVFLVCRWASSESTDSTGPPE